MKKLLYILIFLFMPIYVNATDISGVSVSGMEMFRAPVISFNVNSTQNISGEFSTSGGAILVNWGDGTTDTYNGSDQVWSHDYGSAVNKTAHIISQSGSQITEFEMTEAGADISFDLSVLPASMTSIICYGNNSITGDLADSPPNLTYIYISGNNTIYGEVADFPINITYINIQGNNTINGDLADLPDNLEQLRLLGDNTVSDYSGKTWTTKPYKFYLWGNSSLSAAEVDQLFIDFNNDLAWASGDTIQIIGSCAAPTAASSAARSNITSEGASITTN